MSDDIKGFGAPISEKNPVGIELEEDDDFFIIKDEIDKQLETPDWKLILTHSEIILKEKSKHLYVASYRGIAEIQTNQFNGFVSAMEMINLLLEKFGLDTYPQEESRKLDALRYWIERSETLLKHYKPSKISENLASQIKKEVNRFKNLMKKNFPDYYQPMETIEDILNSIPVDVKDKKESKKADKERENKKIDQNKTDENNKKKSTSSNQSIEKNQKENNQKQILPKGKEINIDNVGTNEGIKKEKDKILNNCEKIATAIRKIELSNSISYYFNRLYAWGNILILPKINSEGNTNIPAPDPEDAKILSTLEQNKEWEALLRKSENFLPDYKFNLNLNRYSVIAAKNLGSSFENAAKTIEQETCFFLIRFPGIEKLTYNDATPFADSKTKKWLNQISVSEGTGSIQLEPEDSQFYKILQDIHSKGSFKEMIPLIQTQIKQAISYKNKHFWRSELVNLLNKNAQYEFMVPHLEVILEDIDTFNIEKWDQDYALKVYIWAIECYQLLSTEQAKFRVTDLHQRIIKLDLVNAMKLFAVSK